MKYLAPCLALALLATPAMAQSIGEQTGMNSTLGISPAMEDFVKQAAISDMFEIQSSRCGRQILCRHHDQASRSGRQDASDATAPSADGTGTVGR